MPKIKIGGKDYEKSNKKISIKRHIKNDIRVCNKCGSEDISKCYDKHIKLDLDYCGSCGKYVADAEHKYCGFCGIKFDIITK
jgi:transcription elongation factor Elf1